MAKKTAAKPAKTKAAKPKTAKPKAAKPKAAKRTRWLDPKTDSPLLRGYAAEMQSFLKAMAGLAAALPAPLTVGWYLSNDVVLAIAAGIVGSMPWVPALAARLARERRDRTVGVQAIATAAVTAILVASIMHVAARTYSPFIYFRF